MTFVRIIIVCFFVQSLVAQNFRHSEQLGNFKKIESVNGSIFITAENGFISLTTNNATTVRVRVTKTKPLSDFSFAVDNLIPQSALKIIEQQPSGIILTTDSLKIHIMKKPVRITVLNAKGVELCADDSVLGISWFGNQVSCYKKLHADEKFIGLGEKTGPLNRRGEYYQHWNSDFAGYSVTHDPLYATIPFFIGIHDKVCYGLFFDNSNRSYFNFGGGADNDVFHFGAVDGEMNYYIFGRSTVPGIIEDYTSLTGRSPMPPLWSLGFQQSRWGYDNPNQFIQLATTFREIKMPADVLVCDISYMDHYKIFTWSDKFPDVKGFVSKMNGLGFELVTIVDPGIKIEKGYKSYEDGIKYDYFAKYPDGKFYTGSVWPGRCHLPDFLKPEVRKWWGESFNKSHTDNGIHGFWNDMNEPAVWGRELPDLIEFGSGQNKQTLNSVRNAYGLLMSRATYEGTRKLLNGKRPFVLTRAGYAGIQKYSAMWTGDNVSTDEHMLLGVRLLNSMAVSGVSFVGTDIGGFLGNPSPELFMRWLNIAVFSPLFRNHTSMNFNYREPWLFGERNTGLIRSILELRYQLLPYIYSAFYQSHLSGLPINRMLPIKYPFDNKVYAGDFENQFLFGDGMMVCPVASGLNLLKVYFPGNSLWYRWDNDNEVHLGGSVANVDAPLTSLPVFVHAGAIIPMQSVIQNTREKGDGVLYLNVWNGNNDNVYDYYEDDGETYAYEQGQFCKRTIRYFAASQRLEMSEVEGNYMSKFNRIHVVLHGFEKSQIIIKDWTTKKITIPLQ